MNCLGDDLVLGLVEGRLPPATLSEVDEHIDSCASCRDVISLVAGARPPGRTLAKGDRVGRFVIGELLGAGAMGRVYAAFEPELDRRVAIKMLIEDDGAGRERLIKEAQAMARLNHPNVVTVHEVATTDAGVFVAMELVEGDSLRAWVDARRPWRDIVRVLTEIARGLAAVHAAGVVHRDLKPDNVIVGADGRVRLGDFGLARAGSKPDAAALAIGTDTTVAGTPAYMAPEVLRGGPASAATDQFSFGVLAYELLAGKRPFSGTTWAELLAAIERGDVAAIPNVPSWLDAAIRRCLATDARERFPSLQAVAEHLARHVSAQKPTRWIAAAAAAAIVASVGTYALVSRSSSSAASCDITIPAEPALLAPWARAWQQERTSACRAHDAARARCLDQRRADLIALIPQLSGPRAVDALAALPPPSECTLATVTTTTPVALALQGELAAARAAVALGHDVTTTTERIVADARATTDDPLLADALLVHAEALRAADRFFDAASFAREATAVATRGHADLLAARAWLVRVRIAGHHRDLDKAEDVGELAAAAIQRIGSPQHLVATLSLLRGLIAYNRGQLAEARTLLLEARSRVAPGSLELAAVESALGSVARAANDLDVAMQHHEAAHAIDRKLRGDRHPDIARDLHNIAGVLRLRGDLPAALGKYREALALEIALQGERSSAAALTRNSIGLVLMAQQDWQHAREEITLARDALYQLAHGDTGFAEHNLGLVAQAQGDHRTALAHFDRAAQIYADTIGDKPESVQRLADDRQRSIEAASAVTSRKDGAASTPIKSQPPVGADTSAGSNTPTGSNAPIDSGAPKVSDAPKEPLKIPAPPTDVPRPTEPKLADPPPKKPRDVGVYGSQQPW